MRRKMIFTWACVLIIATSIVIASASIGGRSYVLASMLLVICSMVPAFVSFELKKPKARELVLLAVMIALAVASRALFAFVPSFKPMAGIIMIAAMGLGSAPGFLVGSLSALLSNFIFGQGPWTPWQMLAYGLAGLIFGFLANRGTIKIGTWSRAQRLAVSFGGFFCVLCLVGPILDTSSVFWMLSSIDVGAVLTIYALGAPFNFVQALATFITVFLLAPPMLVKIERIKTKYGI